MMLARQSNIHRASIVPRVVDKVSGGATMETAPAASFDVIEKAQEFLTKGAGYYSFPDESMYDDDFVFKAKIVGPLNKKDYIYTMNKLKPHTGIDVEPNAFGFTVDPANPLRVFFFVRVTGKHKRPWKYADAAFVEAIEPTNAEVKLPTEVAIAEFTPEGKCKFFSVGNVIYPFEGNSKGLGAIFGLLVAIGRLDIIKPGLDDNLRSFANWFAHTFPDTFGYVNSRSEDIPTWFKELQEEYSLK